MKNFITWGIRLSFLSWMLVFVPGCSSQRIVTTWKTDRITTEHYTRIMVVGILPDKDSLQRRQIENDFVSRLEELGYKASSALSQFGLRGLSTLGQENAYLKLRNNGIDAVVTIALIHKTKQNFHRPGQAYIHPNSYYYNRIWNYRNIQAEDSSMDATSGSEYFWESILFDLATLEAACTMRTQPFAKDKQAAFTTDLSKKIIRKITREGILQKQKTPKAF